MNNALGLLGLARRAGKIAYGEDMTSLAVRDKKARAICTAKDASERVKAFADSCGVVHLPLDITKDALGTLIGKATCSQLAVLDIGIAASIAQKLSAFDSKYSEAAKTLSESVERARKRKLKKDSRKK